MAKIAIIAGEPSADTLGARLIVALRELYPQLEFEGIGGQEMIKQGFHTLFPMEMLSIMGLAEVLGHVKSLLRIRRQLYQHFLHYPPLAIIGIDSPDFNLPLEKRLRGRGIPAIHYVSPSVWAWRQGRIKNIARSVDLVLTLFPFEEEFYRLHQVPVCYVGHPLADEIPLTTTTDTLRARQTLGLPQESTLVALLPGSRSTEIHRLGRLFLQTAQWLSEKKSGITFVAPMATPAISIRFSELVHRWAPLLPITLTNNQSRQVMEAANVILTASGTATLEALLLKRPMVMAYKVAPLTAALAKRLIKISRFSLPNLLSHQDLVPEFIQQQATVENLGAAVLNMLNNPERYQYLQWEFQKIHQQLRRNASHRAAQAIDAIIKTSIT